MRAFRLFTVIYLFLFIGKICNSQSSVPLHLTNTMWFTKYVIVDPQGTTEYGYVDESFPYELNDSTNRDYFYLISDAGFLLNGLQENDFLVWQDSVSEKVFIRSFGDTTTHLFYDFSLLIGDTVQTIMTEPNPEPLIVTDVDTVNILGVDRKRIVAHYNGIVNQAQHAFEFIKGIGSLEGLLVELDEPGETGSFLICMFSYSGNHYYAQTNECFFSVQENYHSELILHPNPSSGVFNMDIKGSTNLINANLELYDVSGKLIKTFSTIESNMQIDLSGYQNGLYYVVLVSDDKKLVKKLVKN